MIFILALLLLATGRRLAAQALDFTAVEAGVHFSKKLRPWDGFGFNFYSW